MKNIVFAAAAALGAVALAPAFAQTAPAPAPHADGMHHGMRMAPVTRAAMLEKIQAHFAMLDADKNGVVTKAEMDAKRGDRMEKRGDKRFDRLDANDDQSISRAEFDAAHANMADHKGMRGHGGMGMRMHGRMFGMADANKDGNVTLQEATAAASAHFDQADANRDGTLTPEEMRAAHKMHRGKPAA